MAREIDIDAKLTCVFHAKKINFQCLTHFLKRQKKKTRNAQGDWEITVTLISYHLILYVHAVDCGRLYMTHV